VSVRNRRHGLRVLNAGTTHLAGSPLGFAGVRGILEGMTFDRLHHVQLAMPRGQEAAARAFFVDVLGMTEIQKPPVLAARGGAWFRAGDVELHLGVDDAFVPAAKAHPGFAVNDLDDLVARLAAAGQHLQWDAELPGFRRIYASDPFGNRLEFLEPH
jgi:catechol 2,3-dioxygenase-like lactoylglutathione lyase family enzyme